MNLEDDENMGKNCLFMLRTMYIYSGIIFLIKRMRWMSKKPKNDDYFVISIIPDMFTKVFIKAWDQGFSQKPHAVDNAPSAV